jgi:hypothetical protein
MASYTNVLSLATGRPTVPAAADDITVSVADFELDTGTFTFTGTTSLWTLGSSSTAFKLEDGSNNAMLTIDTSGNAVTLGSAGNAAITQVGTGQVTFTGNVDAGDGLDVAGGDLSFTGTAGGWTIVEATSAMTQTGTGQVTFTGNVDAGDGLDVSGGALSFTGTGGSWTFAEADSALTQTGSGQVAFTGNVDASSGVDVSGAPLTIANQAITQTTGGQVTFAGNVDANGGLNVLGGNLDLLNDALSFVLGTGSDFSINHDGTDTTLANVTGDLIFDNQAIADLVMLLGANDGTTNFLIKNNSDEVKFTVTAAGDTTIEGNLIVNGDTTTITSSEVNLSDNFLNLNYDYITASAKTGGLVTNYLPVTSKATVIDANGGGYVAGVAATTNPTVDIEPNITLADGALVQLAGADNATNDGIYEVNGAFPTQTGRTGTITTNATTAVVGVGTLFTTELAVDDWIETAGGEVRQVSVITDNLNLTVYNAFSGSEAGVAYSENSPTLSVRGIGTVAAVETFSNNQFVTDATVSGAETIAQVNVSVIRAGTDGAWETGSGNASGIVYSDLAVATGVTLQTAYETGNTIVLSDGDGNLDFQLDDANPYANFVVDDISGSTYIASDVANSKLVLGDSADGVIIEANGNLNALDGLDVSGAALTIANQAITQTTGGQVTFAGNVDADGGLDVEGNFTHATSGTGDIDRAWDFSANLTNSGGELLVSGGNMQLNDSIVMSFGTGDDVSMRWDGTDMDVLFAADDQVWHWGVDNGNTSDMIWHGNATGDAVTFDASANTWTYDDVDLYLGDSDVLAFGDAQDATMSWDGTDMDVLAAADDQVWNWGNGTNSWDMKWFGNTAGDTMTFDASANTMTLDGVDLYLNDSDFLAFGDGQDATMSWDGTDMDVLPAADDSVWNWGNGTNSWDVNWYGAAASDYVNFDASANVMTFENVDLHFNDDDLATFGNTAGTPDASLSWNTTVVTAVDVLWLAAQTPASLFGTNFGIIVTDHDGAGNPAHLLLGSGATEGFSAIVANGADTDIAGAHFEINNADTDPNLTGNASGTIGLSALTGAGGTAFLTDLSANDWILLDSAGTPEYVEIASVTNDALAVINGTFANTHANVTYAKLRATPLGNGTTTTGSSVNMEGHPGDDAGSTYVGFYGVWDDQPADTPGTTKGIWLNSAWDIGIEVDGGGIQVDGGGVTVNAGGVTINGVVSGNMGLEMDGLDIGATGNKIGNIYQASYIQQDEGGDAGSPGAGAGRIYMKTDGVATQLWFRNATEEQQITGAGVLTVSLDEAYNAGNSIGVDTTNGTVQMTMETAAAAIPILTLDYDTTTFTAAPTALKIDLTTSTALNTNSDFSVVDIVDEDNAGTGDVTLVDITGANNSGGGVTTGIDISGLTLANGDYALSLADDNYIWFGTDKDAVIGFDTGGPALSIVNNQTLTAGAEGVVFIGGLIQMADIAGNPLELGAVTGNAIEVEVEADSTAAAAQGNALYIDVDNSAGQALSTGTLAGYQARLTSNAGDTAVTSNYYAFEAGNTTDNSGGDATFSALIIGTGYDYAAQIASGEFAQTGGTGDIDVAWDFSANLTNSAGELLVSGGNMQLNDSIVMSFGTGDDATLTYDGSNMLVKPALDDDGWVWGDTTNHYLWTMTWYGGAASADTVVFDPSTSVITLNGWDLLLEDGDKIIFGTGSDYSINFDGTDTQFAAAAGRTVFSVTDDLDESFLIQEGSNDYLNIDTQNAGASVEFGNATTNPTYAFVGSGDVTLGGDLIMSGTNPYIELEESAKPTSVANTGQVYTKDVTTGSTTQPELFYHDENDNEVQITALGELAGGNVIHIKAGEIISSGAPVVIEGDGAGAAEVWMGEADQAGSDLVEIVGIVETGVADAALATVTVAGGIAVANISDVLANGDVGKPVYLSETNGQCTIDVSGFSSGSYIYRIGWLLNSSTEEILVQPQFVAVA